MKDEQEQAASAITDLETNHLEFNDPRLLRDLLGQHDQHIKILQHALRVKIRVRGSAIEIEGDPLQVELTSQIIRQLYGLLEKGYPVYASDVDYAIRILSGDGRAKLQDIFLDTIYISAHKRTITPKSIAQKAYIDAIRRYDIVFGIGPAGTGKTYLAMAMAVAELMKNNYVRIILTRPAVEAGEKLGFLPGDLAEKVTFAQDHAIVPQNVVGRGDVKIEIRQREPCQVFARCELHRLFAQREIDYSLLGAPEGVCGMPADIGRRLLNTFLHFPKRFVRILRVWGLLAKYASSRALSRITGCANLSGKGKHIGIESRREERSWRDFVLGGVFLGDAENLAQNVEVTNEYRG